MPDNIDYLYMGYAALLVILIGMIAWIVWRYRMARHEEQLIEQFEAEERAHSGASHPAPSRIAVPDPESAVPMTSSTLSEKS